MFNFFQKKEVNKSESQPIYEDQAQVAITYFIDKGDDSVKIDVGLENYSDDSITKLCQVLEVLSQDKAYIETISIIRDGLVANSDEETLMKFLLLIGNHSNKKIINQAKENLRSQPCVSPSDML